jgi:adenylylsulfate kinase
LESDVLRPIFTPQATYQDEDRNQFYRQMVYIGALLTRHGVPVIFDATANRRCYRDRARKEIPQFLEVYLECPLEICVARDPKGIYRKAREGAASTVPGLQAVYEPPKAADIVIRSGEEDQQSAARRIVAKLRENRYIMT